MKKILDVKQISHSKPKTCFFQYTYYTYSHTQKIYQLVSMTTDLSAILNCQLGTCSWIRSMTSLTCKQTLWICLSNVSNTSWAVIVYRKEKREFTDWDYINFLLGQKLEWLF